jgi:cysteine desulfurase/selenocysteine lyase
VRGVFEAAEARRAFPILGRAVHGRPLVYLDSAATAQKPEAVFAAEARFYQTENAAVNRGVHALSDEATRAYEAARERVRRFLGAREACEIVFVRGATEGINLVAQTLRLGPGDEVVVTETEHHSNIVPWQLAAERAGARLRVAPIDDSGLLRLDAFADLLGPRTRLCAVTHVSNVTGVVQPVHDVVALARAAGAQVLLDGAQAAPHLPLDLAALGCDFYVFSGHKTYGPTGIGVLYGRAEALRALPPWQGGGGMIQSVTFDRTSYHDIPLRFEAGSPNVGGAVGLGAALDWLEALPRPAVAAHEQALAKQAAAGLRAVPLARVFHGASLVSFALDGIHPHDLGTVLDRDGVAVRTGHMCAQPLMRRLGVPALTRASFAPYNTALEVEALLAAVGHAAKVLR